MENNINDNKTEYSEEIVGAMAPAEETRAPVTVLDPKAEKRLRRAKRRECFRRSKCYDMIFGTGSIWFVLSFFISAGIMTFAMAQSGIHPFGNRQMLVVDLWHQYFPFFRVVREKLLTGGSFFYSWENGLGSNFLSLISYYAMSPLNWLAVFWNEGGTRDALTFILIMKIGFSGAFFQRFLRYTYRRNDFSTCVFSVMYSLSSFTLGYYWNVMWFDTIALFPLVMLGIVAICRERKWKCFTFSLALSLIANYYVGFFTCIFSVFMFLAAGIIEAKGIKDWFCKALIMLRSTVLGLGLGAFILIPAYYGLEMTYSADERSVWAKIRDIFREDTRYYESWKSLLANTLSYSEPTKVEGLPNFACGMLAILLFGVFLLSRGIKIREKISSLAMLFLIVISCNMRQLNYIWHGLHFTNQIPYRFAFIFSFLLASAAFRAYDIMLKNGIRVYQLVAMLICPVFVFWLNYEVRGDDFAFKGAVRSSAIITAAFWFIFIAVKVFPFKKRTTRNAFMSLALAAAVFSEFVSNAKLGVETVSTSGYNDYPSHYDEVESLLSSVDAGEEDEFYRLEMTDTYTLNDSALYSYYGVSQFSSAANVSVTKLCKRLGIYASEAGNRYYYRTNTPVFSMLFDIRYLIKRGGVLNSESYAMDYYGQAGSTNLYKSKYPTSLGFMMDERILYVENNMGVSPFDYQNRILKTATGIKEDCFIPQPVTLAEYKNMDVTKNGFGNYTFRVLEEGNKTTSTIYTFANTEGMHLYGYASSTGSACNFIDIKCGTKVVDSGTLIDNGYALVFPMGNGDDGADSVITIKPKDDRTSGNYKLMAYALDESVLKKHYEAITDEMLEITDFSDREIKGNITAKKDGVLYLSIPYEKGWRVYVDGKKADTKKVLDAMLGVEVSAGEHEIRLEYIPEGFVSGIIITTVSFVLTGTLIFFEIRRKKRKAAAAAADNAPAGDDPEGSEESETVILGEIYNQEIEELDTAEAGAALPEVENEKSQSDDSVQGD